MPIDLKLVESFVAVGESLSFTVAAARCNTVQSAISAHIRQLESHLGRTLVERGRGRPVALTNDGTAFLVQARRLLALADEVVRNGSGTIPVQPLRLGASVTFALGPVPGALAQYATCPGAAPVAVTTARSNNLMDLLDSGAIDLALVFDKGADPRRLWSVDVDLAWVSSGSFQPINETPLPLAFLEDARDLRRHAFAALDQADHFRVSLTTHPDPVGLRSVLLAGLALTVFPRTCVSQPLRNAGPSLGLPRLAKLPLSLYASPKADDEAVAGLSNCLKTVVATH